MLVSDAIAGGSGQWYSLSLALASGLCNDLRMGNNNAPKREKKKPAKTQPKVASRKREDVNQAAFRVVRESTES